MKLGIAAWYEVNKDYVEDVFCINKNKPEMNCHGKCYLNKQLTKLDKSADTQQKDAPQTSKKVEIVEYLLTNIWSVSEQITYEDALTHHAHYTHQSSRLLIGSVFRPPSA
eukprot:Plantae.Rhodophyta-Hildenbrandia_rubra.ctg43154.p1 GENE.Plantae.Rhodophyta-Hildenbrandia_rubra.ctg43154~~Plantae.Rhodophyta-Hildenbrandia_rubra.ctg43154.p1  ORF type:complete len:110 (+),score=4.23 Plantae.Rhodophyta-Hildenbrandia_rubra.ctg43154:420-749(+)